MHELRRGQPARGMAAHEGGWGLPCWLTGGIGRWGVPERGGRGFFLFWGFSEEKERRKRGVRVEGGEDVLWRGRTRKEGAK